MEKHPVYPSFCARGRLCLKIAAYAAAFISLSVCLSRLASDRRAAWVGSCPASCRATILSTRARRPESLSSPARVRRCWVCLKTITSNMSPSLERLLYRLIRQRSPYWETPYTQQMLYITCLPHSSGKLKTSVSHRYTAHRKIE